MAPGNQGQAHGTPGRAEHAGTGRSSSGATSASDGAFVVSSAQSAETDGLAEGGKACDIERILHSENSEDYVTWNFFQLLDSVPAARWWPALLRLTGVTSLDPTDTPTVQLWRTTAAPRMYEDLSRKRMRSSDNPDWRQRSLDRNAVEGSSEIDITFEGRSYIIFIEAKLGSDVSFRTKYDPERNQIVRNIDCVLEVCGKRRPVFWMFVRDRQSTRGYVELMDRYRTVHELHRSLPHRDVAALGEIASGLAVALWRDLLMLLDGSIRGGVVADVRNELHRRVGLA